MKTLASLLLIAVLAVLSQAQEQPVAVQPQEQPVGQPQPAVSAPKDVLILKFSFNKARVYAVLDASRTGGESFEDMRRRVGGEMTVNAVRNLPGGKAVVGGTPASTAPPLVDVIPQARNGYRYKVELQNAGPMAIKAVAWDYIFKDPVTQEIVARHHFLSNIKIKPGKTKELVAFKLSPPTKTVSAAGLERNNKNAHTEQVVLKSILYADGSVWPHP